MVPPATRERCRPIHLGFVPLSDCAPIAVACETGIFQRYGLDINVSKEVDWAAVSDKIYRGELDAAQSIAGMAFSLGLGLGDRKCEVAVPLLLNVQGSAITLSKECDPAIIGNGGGLASFIKSSWRKDRPLTLAATHRFASHHVYLHTWLKTHGLTSPGDVEIVFLPPPSMPAALEAGDIDGFCVGEPWNSQVVLSGKGWCPVTSSELSQGHTEKVLLVSGKFMSERRDETVALVAALIESCRLCQDSSFRSDLVNILAMDAYTGASPEVLRNCLDDSFHESQERHSGPYYGESVNRPTVEKASWVLAGLRSIGALPNTTAGSLSLIYREDVYRTALHCAGV